MCKKIVTHFNTLRTLVFNLLVKQIAKYCYFDKNSKYFWQFFTKNQFIQKF